MNKLNNGTKHIVISFLSLKEKILLSNLPDEKYILIGINIVEKIIKTINPNTLSNDEIDNIIILIETEVNRNQFSFIDYSIKLGMDMAVNTIIKMKTKTYKK